MSEGGGTKSSDLKNDIYDEATAAVQRAKKEARAAREAATEKVSEVADEQKGKLSQGLAQFAEAVERAGSELEKHDQTLASQVVREAASGLSRLSKSIGGSSTGELVNSFRDFGRANPAAFIGGAVLLGVALGRFARAAPPQTRPQAGGADRSVSPAAGTVAGAPANTPAGGTL